MENNLILTATMDVSEYIKGDTSIADLNNQLAEVGQVLDLYTSKADIYDYALSVASGIISGIIDSKYVKKMPLVKKDLEDSVYNIIDIALTKQRKSKKKTSISELANEPNSTGLFYSVLREFQRIGTFKEEDGEIHFHKAASEEGSTGQMIGMAGLLGIINWVTDMADLEVKNKKKTKKETDEKQQENVITEVKEEEENSDNNDTFLPAAVLGLVSELADNKDALDLLKDANKRCENKMKELGALSYKKGDNNDMIDLFFNYSQNAFGLPIMRDSFVLEQAKYIHEHQDVKEKLKKKIPLYGSLSNQMMPVIINEMIVRTFYFIRHLMAELQTAETIEEIDFRNVIPFNNRTIEQMIMISSMTFTFADTADAYLHALEDSKGNFVLFGARFATKFNYVGYGRAMLSVAKEISNDRKELQLLRERRILAENKSEKVVEIANEFQNHLEELFDQYMEEHLEDFIMGTQLIEAGRRAGDSNLIIQGNVIIQTRLGKEVQFTNQEEFDDLMDSDIPFVL